MFYNYLNKSYQFILSNIPFISFSKSKKSSKFNEVEKNYLKYIKYNNNFNNMGLELLLCFYLDYLIGIKIIKFKHKIIKPTHILKDTIIWDNIDNSDIQKYEDNSNKWINFLDSYFKAEFKIQTSFVMKKSEIINLEIACPNATPFQFNIWKELLNVKHLSTYSEIASKINNEKAVRAAGTAVSQNPIAIFIPCHRILPKTLINSNKNRNEFNEVGQYMHGSEFKKFLLNLEVNMQN